MIAPVHASCFTSPRADLQARFLSIRPRIEQHARIYFRAIRCPHTKADRVAETIALCWKWFARLADRGKDATRFPSVIASFAARAVHSGRQLCGLLKAKDVLSERAQQRHGFSVETIPTSIRTSFHDLLAAVGGQRQLDAFEEFLQHNSQTPIPDQVVFRCDWPAWLKTRTSRARRIIAQMTRNERTKDLARRFGISQGRVSQLRREYQLDWERFGSDRADG